MKYIIITIIIKLGTKLSDFKESETLDIIFIVKH